MPVVGEAAPPFEAQVQSGKMLRSSDLRGKPFVLYFYPEADTPGCTVESKGFRDTHGEFEAKGVAVVGVSVDPCEKQAAFTEKYGLNFPLLADTSKSISRAYGVLAPSGKARRVTFLVDPKGKITDIYEGRDAASHVSHARDALLV